MLEKICKEKKLRLTLLIIAFCMTGTPVVILANRIEPFVFGMPFFLFWNIFWPGVSFLLAIWYGDAVNRYEDVTAGQKKERGREECL